MTLIFTTKSLQLIHFTILTSGVISLARDISLSRQTPDYAIFDTLQSNSIQSANRETNASLILSLLPVPALFVGGILIGMPLLILALAFCMGAIFLGASSKLRYNKYISSALVSDEDKLKKRSIKSKAVKGQILGILGLLIGIGIVIAAVKR